MKSLNNRIDIVGYCMKQMDRRNNVTIDSAINQKLTSNRNVDERGDGGCRSRRLLPKS